MHRPTLVLPLITVQLPNCDVCSSIYSYLLIERLSIWEMGDSGIEKVLSTGLGAWGHII